MFARVVTALLCLLPAAFIPTAVAARAAGPLVEYENVAATTSGGKPATAEQIKKAFMVGGARRSWAFTEAGDNLVGTLNVRTHQIVVDILIQEGKYSVLYKSSVNMKYGMEEGKKVIHPQYNNWVNNLLGDMRAELAKL